MPNIPSIPLPEVETAQPPAPYDTRRRSPGEYGAAVAEGLGQLAQGVDAHMAEADTTRALQAEAAYNTGIADLLDGKIDPKTGEATPGFRQLNGQEALDASGRVRDELAQRRQIIANGLANDRQRSIFLAKTQGDLIGASRQVEHHVGAQIAAVREQEWTTLKEAAERQARGAYLDPEETDRILEAIQPWAEDAARRAGMKPGPDAERYVREQQGQIVVPVLERMLEETGKGRIGLAKQARAFLEAHRDVIPEKVAYRFRERLYASDLRERGLQESDRVWKASGGDEVRALELLRENPDLEVRIEAEKFLAQRVTQDEQVRKAKDRDPMARVETKLLFSRRLDTTDPDYTVLSPEGKRHVAATWNAILHEGTTEQNAYDQTVLNIFKSYPPTAQLGIDINTDRMFEAVSPKGRAAAGFIQSQTQKQATTAAGFVKAEIMRRADAIADARGWPRAKAGQITARSKFLDAVGTAADAWLDGHPDVRAIPPEEARRIIRDEIRYGTVPGVLEGRLGTTNEVPFFQSRIMGKTFTEIPNDPRTQRLMEIAFPPGTPGAPNVAPVLPRTPPPVAMPPRAGARRPPAPGPSPRVPVVHDEHEYGLLPVGASYIRANDPERIVREKKPPREVE